MEINPILFWNLILTLVIAPAFWTFRGLIAEVKRIDILVNNAAILVPGATIDFPERYFDRMFEILVKAPHHLCQLVLPQMIDNGEGGEILNISSSAARHPKPDQQSYDGAVYGMAKAAIERFTTGLASEM